MAFTLDINGKRQGVDAEGDTPLLWVLRDRLSLTGTKYGCGIGQCGACTVHLEGKPVRACLTPIATVGARRITTIEGLAKDGNHPVQRAWRDERVPQCGYCQSGQIMSASALLATNASPSPQQVREAMQGNICRCGTYPRIEKAVMLAARYAREGGGK